MIQCVEKYVCNVLDQAKIYIPILAQHIKTKNKEKNKIEIHYQLG